MKRIRRRGLFLLLCLPLAAFAANPAFEGRWRLDPAQSTALDGWTSMDLVVQLDGPRISLRHEMAWRATRVTATNVVSTAGPVEVADFFRIDQRHMAVYSAPKKTTRATAGWVDAERTLRLEAFVPVEISQGEAAMRIYSEYRLLEGEATLLLIELHHTRSRPLVYRFTKVPAEAAKK
ncbi:MAG: hypothetical protein HY736_11220 [Verrucomicrobia bacterium]|nr:hypothetical protein [Verrucomicrobiota bacterium]